MSINIAAKDYRDNNNLSPKIPLTEYVQGQNLSQRLSGDDFPNDNTFSLLKMQLQDPSALWN